MRGTEALGVQPADELISAALISFDESGVHHAWTKALGRRGEDPEGALTAAKTLLETVCKHIIDEAGGTYGDNDDLPKLYIAAAECLRRSRKACRARGQCRRNGASSGSSWLSPAGPPTSIKARDVSPVPCGPSYSSGMRQSGWRALREGEAAL
jgi:predicted RNA-binding Zn ribbon-like protein